MKTKILIILLLISFVSFSQKSPAQHAEGTINDIKISIDYSSPHVRERIIYGDLVPYGEVWRAGANKNTTIEFSSDVTINSQKLVAGKYSFFIIPYKNKKWTAIFNKKNDGWGAFSYNTDEDALRIETQIQQNQKSNEELTYSVTQNGITFSWSKNSFLLHVK